MAPKINFNKKHLTKGDPLPPFNGKLRIYNMRFCPYAQRTVLVLNAKQLDYEVVNVDLVDKPESLTSKSLFGKVPALEVKDGVCITESLVTSEYLDEAYPQRPLLPKDPVKKAHAKIIVEASSAVYINNMLKDPAVSQYLVPKETLLAYEKGKSLIMTYSCELTLLTMKLFIG